MSNFALATTKVGKNRLRAYLRIAVICGYFREAVTKYEAH